MLLRFHKPQNLFNGFFHWRQFLLNLYNLLLAIVLAIQEIKPQWAQKTQMKLYEQVRLSRYMS